MGKCKPQKHCDQNKVSPVEYLLCLPVLQIYRDCVYLHYKFLLTAGICMCILLLQAPLFFPVAVAAIVAVIMTGHVVVAAGSKTILS